MKLIKSNLRKIYYLITLLISISLSGCGCGFSERCYEDRERKRFLSLSPEQQKQELEECKKWVPVSCYAYSKTTSEEIKD